MVKNYEMRVQKEMEVHGFACSSKAVWKKTPDK
jgi:hypothetical protein